VIIWYIFPVLVFCVKKNLATLVPNRQIIHLKTCLYIYICGLYFWSKHTHIMHIKSISHNSIDMFSLKTSYPDGIRTRVLMILWRVRCPLRHAAKASFKNLFCRKAIFFPAYTVFTAHWQNCKKYCLFYIVWKHVYCKYVGRFFFKFLLSLKYIGSYICTGTYVQVRTVLVRFLRFLQIVCMYLRA
jgi:hypothetical protein